MASVGKLPAMQVRILGTLAGLTPRWTLSGGGALAGVYTQHRTTRDLDLFCQARRALERAPEEGPMRALERYRDELVEYVLAQAVPELPE